MKPGLSIPDDSAMSLNHQLTHSKKVNKAVTSISSLLVIDDSQINGKWRPDPAGLNKEKTEL
jgi:hypothetical protein